jgi:uncharacterized protein (DUF58 family)
MDAAVTREILKKVRQVELRTRRLVTDALAGEYHSVFKGRGMDFDEVREYAPGDEVRLIDWNVTARTGTPFIKKLREERELTILLAVDVSGSGKFGSQAQSKRELAAEVASVLAFSAILNRDKVGLLLFSDDVEQYVPPGKGRTHVLRVIRDILFHAPRRAGTDVAAALDFVNDVLRRRAVVFVISDFIESPEAFERLRRQLRLTNKRHDLVLLHLRDRSTPAASRCARASRCWRASAWMLSAARRGRPTWTRWNCAQASLTRRRSIAFSRPARAGDCDENGARFCRFRSRGLSGGELGHGADQ